jgi:ribose transport system substrate-binding protein
MITKRTFGRLAIAAAVATLFTSAMAADVTVAYITNGNTNEGWTLINGGAKKAGSAPGVKFIELAAEKGELSKQLAIVEDMITRKVNAIAIAPVDSAGIAPAINKALAAGRGGSRHRHHRCQDHIVCGHRQHQSCQRARQVGRR